MKTKIAFIIPYFGKFNNYFQLFLNSCAVNKEVTWLLFTDNHDEYNFPDNVIVNYTSFQELKEYIQLKFDFHIQLNYVYKLCDFRPMYGDIFAEYLQNYDFWGYCDTDLIFGKISDFLNDELLSNYDKVGVLGHCTLMRNSKNVNNAYRLPLNNKQRFKQVLTSNYNVSFDEEHYKSINNLMEVYGFRILKLNKEANPYTKSSVFRLNHLNEDWTYKIEKPKKSVFVWDHGNLVRYIQSRQKIKTENYMYIHFQSRKMKNIVSNFNKYKIIPNSFENLEIESINNSNFPKYKHLNMHYFRLRSHNLVEKTRKFITRSNR
ncbi:DUF6625 family protein [Limosilactobacillus reuteri]|uniref:DUF6625 family protein n=1 Tax=Limosilactobacillus reuteri TaxID=1598 RepID=UPI000B98FE91|nr:DUF6625 family protein [Limosilactobacillus reuteri]OYT08699.1 hypothetical protein CBG26_07240 [Limosilactobacillus reuteri]